MGPDSWVTLSLSRCLKIVDNGQLHTMRHTSEKAVASIRRHNGTCCEQIAYVLITDVGSKTQWAKTQHVQSISRTRFE